MVKSYANDLATHVPLEAVEPLMKLMHSHQIRLVITKDRVSKLGDFRPAVNGSPAKISVNGSLNVYEFLLVFLHELAHFLVHQKHGRTIKPHGRVWKQIFGELIRNYVDEGFFHPSLRDQFVRYSYQVRATGIADLDLAKALRRFDRSEQDLEWHYLEELPGGVVFRISNGRLFSKKEKVRRRFSCQCLDSKKNYLIHPMARVWRVNS